MSVLRPGGDRESLPGQLHVKRGEDVIKRRMNIENLVNKGLSFRKVNEIPKENEGNK